MATVIAILMRVCSVFMALLQFLSLSLFKVELPHFITVQPKQERQGFEGWGTSSCWWSQTIGSEAMADEIAKALYSKAEGLGLDIYRYNVGGGEKDNPACRIWDVNRRTESFYAFNGQTGQYEYDFSRDTNARRVLDKAVAYGAKELILFCNSPHFSMTLSGQASGGLTAGVSNLPRENYQAFVDYLLTIADWFVDQGYPVTGISPINEPQWGWGGDWVGQEGCHYEPDEAVALLELFAVTMQQRGVPYKLMGPESGEMTEGYNAYLDKFFASEILNAYCDTFSGHSYWIDNDLWAKKKSGERFKSLYPNKKFEMSEWCELPMKLDATTIDSGLYMANIIVQDLTLLNAVSWQSWTAVNGDGVLDIKNGSLQYYSRYWAFKQFSSFIHEGAKRVEVVDSFGLGSRIASVAFTQEEETVLVLVNNAGTAQDITLGGAYGAMRVFTTDAGKNCEQSFDGDFTAKQTLPARSISTFILAD